MNRTGSVSHACNEWDELARLFVFFYHFDFDFTVWCCIVAIIAAVVVVAFVNTAISWIARKLARADRSVWTVSVHGVQKTPTNLRQCNATQRNAMAGLSSDNVFFVCVCICSAWLSSGRD